MGAVRKFSFAHSAKEIEVLVHAATAKRTRLSRLGQSASISAHFVGRQAVDVCEILFDESDCAFVEAFKVIRSKEQSVMPVESQPSNVILNRLNVLGIFRCGVGVVHAEMADPARLFICDAKVKADRLRMAYVKIPVRFGRKAGDHESGMFAGSAVRRHNLADKVRA